MKTANDLISIIIVNYNGKKWLKKCLDSLRAQSYKQFEVIMVDNASFDDSVIFVKKKYPEVIIVESDKNLGFAGGNNLGINRSKGEYVLLLNNDTWIDNNFLEKIYSYYQKNKFDLISAHEKDYENINKFYLYNYTIDFFGHPVLKLDEKPPFYLSGVCLFFSKKLYFKTKGMDNNFFMYFEEVDWFWRLNLLNKKFSYVKDAYIYHYGSGSTGKGIKYLLFLWRNQNTLQMLLKNYEWFNLLWILPIYIIQNIIEIIFFLIILRPKIAFSYLEGWAFNIKNFSRTMKKRKWVQKNRLNSDWTIIKKMYFGFGKINHLINFYIVKSE